MKIKRILSAIILVVLIGSAVMMSSCASCFSDKSSSGTLYNVMLIGAIEKADELTLNGASWRAIKKYAEGTELLYKYYEPSTVEANNYIHTDNMQSSEAVRASIQTQINIASNQRVKDKSVIVITGQDGIETYLSDIIGNEKVDYGKAFSSTWFLLVGGSTVSDAANADKLGVRTMSLILNEKDYGALCGYTAVKTGYKNIGYLGSDSAYSASFKAGIQEGIEKAKTELSITDAKLVINDSYSDSADTRAQSLYGECDVVIPENAVFEDSLKNSCGDKKFVSLTENSEKSAFACVIDYNALQTVIQNTLTATFNLGENKEARTVGAAENIFKIAE